MTSLAENTDVSFRRGFQGRCHVLSQQSVLHKGTLTRHTCRTKSRADGRMKMCLGAPQTPRCVSPQDRGSVFADSGFKVARWNTTGAVIGADRSHRV